MLGLPGDNVDVPEALEAASGHGPILASLKIELVSFVAKNGPMKGQTVSYNKPVLTLKGLPPTAE
ncbi:hypothetical protein BIU92_14000 [Curtobacterium sp. MCBA15_003]|nr:hypothetical protein BIU92_14000 [Curtobacterium sp. MCBA15_003]OII32563.1 hypothetical protein BIU94_04475 [Curtobacterium sp. MMLR14_006]